MIKPWILKFKSRTSILLAAIFLTALAIRIIYIYQIQPIPLTDYVLVRENFDQSTFHKGATAIAQGDWLLKEVKLAPGVAPLYCYFLGLIYKLFNFSPFAARIAQAFLGTGLCILLYFIGKEIFNETVGIVSALIASFYGPFIFYTGELLRASFVTFLNVLLLFLLVRLSKKPGAKLSLFSGIVYELSFLTRQNILLPFILIWLWIVLRKIPFKKFLKVNVAFVIGIFFVATPFLIRNYIVFDKSLAAPATFEGFWVGNTYDSAGLDLYWKPTYQEMVEKCGNSLRKTVSCFIEEIRKRPKTYLNLYRRKIIMFFNGYEIPANTNYYLSKEFPTILRFPWFSFILISPLGLIGMCLALFSQKRISILYIFLLALSAIVILFHVQARYRIPVIPLFIIFASYALYWCVYQWRIKRYFPLLLLAIAMVPIFLFTKPDPSYRGYRNRQESVFVRLNDYGNLANSYIYELRELRLRKKQSPSEKLLNEAIRHLKKRVALEPYSKETAFYRSYLGSAYFEKGQVEIAKKEWNLALMLDPDYELAKTNLILLKYKPGEASEEAIVAFKNILEENPKDLSVLQSLSNIYLGLGKVEEAISEYKKAISYYPEVIELYIFLKKAHDMKGLSKEEIQKRLKGEILEVQKMVEIKSPPPSYQLGMEYIMNKDYNKAIVQFQKALKESPDSVNTLINLGVAYRAAKKPQEAISVYEQALKIAPEAIPARYNLAMVLLSEERFKEAIPHLESIVSIFPEYLLSGFHLAGAYEKTGLTGKAIQEYQGFIHWAKNEPNRQRQVEQAKDKVAILQERLQKSTVNSSERLR